MRNTLLLVAIAAVISLAVGLPIGFFLMHWHDEASKREVVMVLVARASYPARTPVDAPESLFEETLMLRRAVPANAVFSLSELNRPRVLRRALHTGEVVTSSHLMVSGLDSALPSGARAVSIKIDLPPDSVAGMRVDVLRKERGDGKEQDAKVVLTNVLVRALDTPTEGMPAQVTFELTPEQALTLLAARESGTIVLKPR